jgi:hypothetical protein
VDNLIRRDVNILFTIGGDGTQRQPGGRCRESISHHALGGSDGSRGRPKSVCSPRVLRRASRR